MTDDTCIERRARELREQLVPPKSARPAPVVSLAEQLGYEVIEFTPTPTTEAIAGAVDRNEKIIYVNKKDSAARKRFTIAHEIGHIVLHPDEPFPVDFRRQQDYSAQDEPKEREANRFAVELLMPAELFGSLWQAYSGDIRTIAEMLQVSREAATVRSRDLGLRKNG